MDAKYEAIHHGKVEDGGDNDAERAGQQIWHYQVSQGKDGEIE
ncbi:hypothetical protein KDH_53700 [Dictyobacter sp. S3.2.2.5]|uniref:Uncharacterized protein n=1 Tax=Dictyobacter halimunensis TaxID=3026934 RepID=A0ABQ6G1B0_9CHLR|nr:hypothetical protein KDH_53700 [Dictyobacter sp. S3.2.2.5]